MHQFTRYGLMSVVYKMCCLLCVIAVAPDGQGHGAPIVSVQRSLYLQHTTPGVAVNSSQYMPGPGLERIEILSYQSASDTFINGQERFSSDNGQSWSAYQSFPNSQVFYSGVETTEEFLTPTYDPQSNMLIEPWLRIIRNNGQNYIHTYYRLSADHGQTWSTPKMLTYEAGPQFNPSNPLDANYLNTNEASYGQKFIATSDGRVILGVDSANDPNDPLNDQRAYRLAALNFVGKWNPNTNDYDWQAGSRTDISINKSSRGLLEGDVAELKDGRILDIWRGSNAGLSGAAARDAGHKWFGISNDGGLTLSAVQELKFDDGTSFYSPSSQSQIFRLQADGKLYWIGNISPTVPNGNSPRYPLVIAEFYEDKLALKKDTVTTIATRLPGQSSSVQYSNFSVLENPVTHQVEIYLTELGALSGSSSATVSPNVFDADCYRYTLTFFSVPEPPAGALLLIGLSGLLLLRRRAQQRFA